MADFADRSLSIGYPGGSSILFLLVVSSLVVWKMTVGTVSVNNIVEPRVEMYYWLTILLLSNTLGTALGDWTSEGTGFGGGVFLFLGLIAIVTLLYFLTNISRMLAITRKRRNLNICRCLAAGPSFRYGQFFARTPQKQIVGLRLECKQLRHDPRLSGCYSVLMISKTPDV